MEAVIGSATGVEFSAVPVETPEPASATLFTSGLLLTGAGLFLRRRKEG